MPLLQRRQWLLGLMPSALWADSLWAQTSAKLAAMPPSAPPRISPNDALRFPRDFGAHPAFHTEWWYLTGTLRTQATGGTAGRDFGFQITFFRSRVDVASQSQSAFAVKQLVFAHTALSDLQGQQLLHDQRIARAGLGGVQCSDTDTDLALRDWTLQRQGPSAQSRYRSHIAARDFTLDLDFDQTQSLLLQGQAGFSQKGPRPDQASHYYSQPQLHVSGQLVFQGQTAPVQGRAWLDHEWSESMLAQDAVGWDWIGMNLHDGSALMAFRLRRRDGSTLWAGGSLRAPGQTAQALSPKDVAFTPGRIWRSPATGTAYPVEWTVRVKDRIFTVSAKLDAQELDSRGSTGSIYWEGLSVLRNEQGQELGQGYLEMTGYASALRL